MEKNKNNHINTRKRIMGICIIVSITFSAHLGSNAQVPLYYPFYYPSSYFAPYSYFPVYYPSYYPAPAFNTYNYAYSSPLPVPSIGWTAQSVFPNPSASISGLLTDLLLLSSTDIQITPTIASLLINTGNPQVEAVLTLIADDPSLLEDPLLLNALINTGNSQVSLILSLLTL